MTINFAIHYFLSLLFFQIELDGEIIPEKE